MSIVIIVAIIFIGGYFYNSASNIGKNGFLWFGIALSAFLITSTLTGLIVYFLLDSHIGFLGATLIAGVLGIFSLGVVNNFMNVIPD